VRRAELEHVLRAAARVVGQQDFLVVGSAAILASVDDELLPVEATRSDEADLAPYDDPDGEKSLAVEGSLGQGSRFHDSFGYYADGVDMSTALAPAGWKDRLVSFDPPGAEPGRGWCLERHDLVVAKLVAGRAKDYEFADALLRDGLVDLAVLIERLESVPRDRVLPGYLNKARNWLEAKYAEA